MIPEIDAVILVVLAVAVAIAPPWMLRRHLSRWAIAESLFWAAALVLFAALQALEIAVAGTLLFAIAFVARTSFFVILVLSTDQRSLPWSTKHAVVVTGLVYLLLIPHVLRWPIDGDEPYFILVSESIVADGDLDLANQYADLSGSETGRVDLVPQPGDPVGENGEIYSRHEPFFSFALIPGLLAGGLYGAVAIVALLGAILVGSILRLAEENGFAEASRSILWPAVALAPPILFYSVRLWAEVPGALAFSESIRAMRARNWRRFVVWLVVLSLLQFRFGLLAIGLLAAAIWREKPRLKTILLALAALLVPFAVAWLATGRFFGVHQIFELLPTSPLSYLRGLAGLLIDGQAGLLFQAPLWFLALLGILRREDRSSMGWLWLVAVPYLVLLVPRSEWHGGWSPPLRYLVVLTPIFAIGIARGTRWLPRSVKLLAWVWTTGLVVHGIAYPSRLFHIASGESVLGESLSRLYRADVSRLIPSLIRLNVAALVWILVIVVGALMLVRFHRRIGMRSAVVVSSLAIAVIAYGVRVPGSTVQLEDAHVVHRGGELYPERWTVARFGFRGGWAMTSGSVASFRMKPGEARIEYASGEGALVEVDRRRWRLPATEGFEDERIVISDPNVDLEIISGSAVIDRIVHE